MSDAVPIGETAIEPTPTATPRPASAFAAGTVLGTYRIVSHIGRGGMGDVYRALDVNLEREVAVKTIVKALGADESFVARFKEEAKAAARITHPNLVQVHAFGEHEGTLFFAMELVSGRSLGDRLRDGPVPWREAARFAAQAARGLEAAAAHGVIHRDVKPENLLVGADGAVKVADFGLAKRLQSDAVNTASGVIVGTPRYMSPEQAQGDALDWRSDMYSLGATLFHLVAGRPVFDGNSAMKVCMKHIQEPPPSLASVAPGVPDQLSRTVGRMLSKRREERYASYAVLVAELEAIASGSGEAVTVLAPAPAPLAHTPGGTARPPIVQVVKRPDGGFEVGLNCPVEKPMDAAVKQARATAPLAPPLRRLLGDAVDLAYTLAILAILGLIPFPYSPYPQAIFGIFGSCMAVQFLTRRGGTIGERLAQVRLVSKAGGLPSYRAVGMGWLLEKGFPSIIFLCVIAWSDLQAKLGFQRLLICTVGLGAYVAVEQVLAFCTGRSLRDRVYGTRVVDVRGLPDEDVSE